MAMFGSTNKKDSLFSNMDFEISSDLRMEMIIIITYILKFQEEKMKILK